MKTIDWNKASELGLLERINREILHPLGLAMSREVETGRSNCIYVAPDKSFTYNPNDPIGEILSVDEIHQQLK